MKSALLSTQADLVYRVKKCFCTCEYIRTTEPFVIVSSLVVGKKCIFRSAVKIYSENFLLVTLARRVFVTEFRLHLIRFSYFFFRKTANLKLVVSHVTLVYFIKKIFQLKLRYKKLFFVPEINFMQSNSPRNYRCNWKVFFLTLSERFLWNLKINFTF